MTTETRSHCAFLFRRASIITGLGLCTAGFAYAADAGSPSEVELEETTLQSEAEPKSSYYSATPASTATGLGLDVLETPQSISLIEREQIDDFGLDEVNSILKYATGVNVEAVETDRTYYTARGFDVTNFQYDGQGVPMVYGNVYGSLDAAVYERVEVLRGANGLMTGTGNPSATINFVRKKPTTDFGGYVDYTYGSWDKHRVEADVSGSLDKEGRVRGRFVAAHTDQGSYLDRYERESTVLYGTIEADLTDRTLLTVGHSYEDDNADGVMWGSLPVAFSDGSPTDYDVSTSTSADWSEWDNMSNWTFVRLEQELGDRWKIRGDASYVTRKSDGKLFYMYSTPDPTTGLGLLAYPSAYVQDDEQWIYDLQLSGAFDWLGREHELVGGFSYSESDVVAGSAYGPIGDPIPVPLEQWNGDFPEPNFGDPGTDADWLDKEYGFYGAARLRPTDRLQTIVGGRVTTFDGEGVTYGASQTTSYHGEFIPYLGFVYEVNDRLSVYGSYTSIFQPQTEADINGSRLEPIAGDAYEVGLKLSLFESRAYATAAVFRIEQDNVAEPAGMSGGMTYYTAAEGLTSEGFETELVGELIDGLQLSAGYTFLEVEDPGGSRAKPYLPEHSVKLAATYQVPNTRLQVGGGVRWQSEIYGTNVEQEAYAIVDLMARYQFNDKLSAQLNLRNVTDEKYWTSLYWAGQFGQGFYGAPRSADLSLRYEF